MAVISTILATLPCNIIHARHTLLTIYSFDLYVWWNTSLYRCSCHDNSHLLCTCIRIIRAWRMWARSVCMYVCNHLISYVYVHITICAWQMWARSVCTYVHTYSLILLSMCKKVWVWACMSVHERAAWRDLVGACNFLGIIAFPLVITSPLPPPPQQ